MPGQRGREVRAVQDASLFASFTSRWVAVQAPEAPVAVVEAKLCGVGLLGPDRHVVLAAERPPSRALDEWAAAPRGVRGARAPGRPPAPAPSGDCRPLSPSREPRRAPCGGADVCFA